MAQRPTVRWNEQKQRWMAWVRFPDGSRRKIERTEKATAERDLDEPVSVHIHQQLPQPGGGGRLAVDMTSPRRLEKVYEAMVRGGVPDVDARQHWSYPNRPLQQAARHAGARGPKARVAPKLKQFSFRAECTSMPSCGQASRLAALG